MKYYTGIGNEIKNLKIPPNGNYLFSFIDSATLCYSCLENIPSSILIDSGAFTLQKKGISQDKVWEYAESYSKFIKQTRNDNRIKGYFELDIDEHIGYENVIKIRNFLLDKSDKIIPVWHYTLGLNEFKKMCQDYDYISISCVRDKDIPPNQLKYFVKYAHNQKTKIHGLGMTRKKILDTVPFDSVDSTSWKMNIIYGNYKRINQKSKKIKRNISKTHRIKLFQGALIEDILKQKYYKDKWEWYNY